MKLDDITMSEFDWCIHAILVAGKSAKFGTSKITILKKFACNMDLTMEDYLFKLWNEDKLIDKLKEIKTGKYQLLGKTFDYLFKNKLNIFSNLDTTELEKIPGIGMKSSRFLKSLVESNHNDFAILDVHILKWMKTLDLNLEIKIPSSTPNKKEYLILEKVFIAEANKRGKTSFELDREIWYNYTKDSGLQKLEKNKVEGINYEN